MTVFALILFIIFIKNVSSNNLTEDTNVGFVNCDKCIAKCCPIGLYIRKKQCVQYSEFLNLSSYPVYTKEIMDTGKVLADYFTLIPRRFNNTYFQKAASNVYQYGYRNYLTENRTLYLEKPNAFERWIQIHPRNYCIDFQLPNKLISTPQVRTWVILETVTPSEPNHLISVGLIISCVFMSIVLLVYSLLPELRNLCGKILMAYVSCLMSSFMVLVAMQKMTTPDESTCIGITLTLYFLVMATFCWMNIMSCDIWWTFRGYVKARPIHRRGEFFKFFMYCLYAFGVPLAMTIFLYVVNSMDLTHLPWFVKPKIPFTGCLLNEGEKLYYMYLPMLIMIIFNWMFYLMTAYNIRRLSKGTAYLQSAAAGTPAAHRSHRHRFMIYVNLSALMGLNWIFEVASSFQPDLQVWWFTDTLNALIGVVIFFVFVFKIKIYKKLVKRFSYIMDRKDKIRGTLYPKSQTTSTTDSGPDTPLQVCSNPRGIP